MVAEQKLYLSVLLFIYLHFLSSRFAISQPWFESFISIRNSTAGLSTYWINRPSLFVNSTDIPIEIVTPILLRGNNSPRFLCGFSCNYNATECFLGILLFHNRSDGQNDMINFPQLVWSANRNHPVKTNATLQLGQDGNLVLADSDGTVVWSTNTAGKSVSGLNLTETGNLVLFDKRKRAVWQSFDHPTDSLLPGQSLVSGQKLIASVSASNWSQGLLSLTILNGSWATYIDSDPPQPYFYDTPSSYSPYYSFDGQTFTALQYSPTPATRFMKLGPDGHLRVYEWSVIDWKESDVLFQFFGDCGYPMVCGRYSICINNGQCICPNEGNFFRPSSDRKPDLGCTELTSISCDSLQYHSLIELKNTAYFAGSPSVGRLITSLWTDAQKLEDCKRACLSNCSCKAVVWAGNGIKNCLLVNKVFSIIDSSEREDGTTFFLKVQNSSKAQNSSNAQNQSSVISGGKTSRSFKVIIGSTLAALFGIALSITTCFVLLKKRTQFGNAEDFLDLEPILPGILTRFSYNDLKIITEDFSTKLGEGGFGSVYEGTMSDGTKIAVKRLDGLGQVKESFLTEVKVVGSIHHVNLVKLIGFCAEKSYRLLIYEYMVNGSLDKWIFHENGLTWQTRQKIILDIAKGLAYLHEECSQKIIHLDIKPQNILLDQNFNAKISDFGLSKLIEKDKSKVMTRMRGTPGYLAPEWLRSVITEKVDVFAFGIVLLELLCGRKNLDWSQADEEDVHLPSIFRRKAEQQQLMDMVDKNNEDMQLNKEAVTEMMCLAAWCLQGDFTKRPSMTLVVKVLEGLVTVETNLDYDFTTLPEVGAGNQQMEATISSKFPSVLSGPR